MSMPFDLEALRAAVDNGESFTYRYFWGHKPRADGRLSDSVFSQWWRSSFVADGTTYSSAEQFMMAGKARLFGDTAVLARILATDDPARVKALGREVAGFDEQIWAAARFELVLRGNLAKFGGDPQLRAYLLGTGDELLVEASPVDFIWGIGLPREAADARDPRRWRGLNLLGFALIKAREQLA